MYNAIDSYLNVATWHTSHPLDDERFYTALGKIVRDPSFDAQSMGNYMHSKTGGPGVNQTFDDVIDRRIAEAYAIHHFVKLGV